MPALQGSLREGAPPAGGGGERGYMGRYGNVHVTGSVEVHIDRLKVCVFFRNVSKGCKQPRSVPYGKLEFSP